MARARNTKKLSQRIDREYFKRLYPIPRWRRILSAAFTIAGLAWVIGSAVNSGAVFSAGPLSKGHHILSDSCESCHTGTSLWGRKVEEPACLTCHDGPAHQEQQTFAPSCLSCHVEHKGEMLLASAIGDASCTQCHAKLESKDGKLTVAANVKDFGDSHPEFALIKNATPDPGTFKFNHEVHLKKGLRGPDGPVELTCAGCHVIEASGSGPGSAMTTVNFEKHCESCHALEFNKRVPERLPHDKPEVAVAFARRVLAGYIAAHPGDVNIVEPALDPKIMSPRRGPAGNAAEWIRRGMEDTETLMWRKSCIECHTPTPDRQIPEAKVTTTWFTGAKFDHMAHQTVGCVSCHPSVKESKLTSDVLLPGVAVCRECHRQESPSASAKCTECHGYHDWSKAKPVDTERTIQDLLRR